MVSSGYSMIPYAKQVDDLFGPAWHFTSNYQQPNLVEWCTETLFAGRYELHMRVQIKINKQTGKVLKVVGEPHFVVMEVTDIDGRSVTYDGDNHEFGMDEWNSVVDKRGDFSSIGILLDDSNPVPGFTEYRKRLRNGIQMKQ